MIKMVYKMLVPERTRLNFHILLRKMKAKFLRGNRYFCPCCEKSSRQFLKKGNGLEIRENAVCPNCGSLERTRLLYLYLQNETEIFKENPAILHFAPEESLKQKFQKNPNYIDADINPNLASHTIDITNINFPDARFDFIICSHVLGHIPDEKKAISELYRVLKKGGHLFLLSLMDPSANRTLEEQSIQSEQERLRFYGEKDLERLYGNDFENRIKAENVSIQRIDYRTNFSPEDQLKIALGNGKREIIYRITRL